MRALLAIGLGIIACGCNAKREADSPNKLGVERREGPPPADLGPAAFRLTLEEPKDGKFEAGQPISCVVRLDLPAGEKPPFTVQLQLRRAKSIVANEKVKRISTDGEPSLRFSGSITPPETPGRYQLFAVAPRIVSFEQDGKTETRSDSTDSAAINITIEGVRR